MIESRANIALGSSTTLRTVDNPFEAARILMEVAGQSETQSGTQSMGLFWASLDSSDFSSFVAGPSRHRFSCRRSRCFASAFDECRCPRSRHGARNGVLRAHISRAAASSTRSAPVGDKRRFVCGSRRSCRTETRRFWPSLSGTCPPRRSCRPCASGFSWALPSRGHMRDRQKSSARCVREADFSPVVPMGLARRGQQLSRRSRVRVARRRNRASCGPRFPWPAARLPRRDRSTRSHAVRKRVLTAISSRDPATRHRRTSQRSPLMFASITAKLSSIVRTVVRAVGALTRRSPWLTPIAILGFFFLV
jgi:hypothetical protein